MKKIIIIICFLVVTMIQSFAQNKGGLEKNKEVEKVLAVYKSEVKPYLKVMAEKEYPQKDDLTMTARYARFLVLEVYHKVIRKDVYEIKEMARNMESVPASGLGSIPYIDVMVKMEYQRVYPGLPYEFYKKASEKANGN